LTHKNEGFRYEAALTLASRKDGAGLDTLIELAHNSKSSWRGAACMALVRFPDNPRVEEAIRSCLDDREGGGQAKEALRRLRAVQKK
jgi:hypothetical protein